MKRTIITLLASFVLGSCNEQKVEGLVVKKTKITTEHHRFYTLSVLMNGDTINCNVSRRVFKKYDVGDSVQEKYRYWAVSAE